MRRFEVGKNYAQEYACGDGRYRRECLKRTEKTVTFRENGVNEIKRYKIRLDSSGNEWVINAGWITSEPTAQFNLCTL